MNLFEVTKTRPIPTIPMPSDEVFEAEYVDTRTPVLLDNIETGMPFTREWTLEFFCKKMRTVRVHRPSEDGVFHFLSYERIPVDEFLENRASAKDMYTLEPLIGLGAPQGSDADRRSDFSENDVPGFIHSGQLKVSNLYIGPGDNKTLLHFDEVHSLLIMIEGEKKFALYSPQQTGNVYPYSAFNVKSVYEQRVVDSKANPVDIDVEKFPKLKDAVGWEGTMRAGQALFIPAGTWHYIESDDPNIAVNYFWYHGKLKHWFSRPLSDFCLKRVQLAAFDVARSVKARISR